MRKFTERILRVLLDLLRVEHVFKIGLVMVAVGQTCFVISFVFLVPFSILTPAFGVWLPAIGVALNIAGAIFMGVAYCKKF